MTQLKKSKAVISNRIYLTVDDKQKEEIVKELSYEFVSGTGRNTNTERICDVTRVNKSILTIPVGRLDLIPKACEIVEKQTTVPVAFPKFKMTLREDQQEIVDQIDSNCIIKAKPGWGKTFAGLYVAAQLGQKTLVVVDRVALRDQWEEEILKVFGIKCGIIGSGRFDIDSPIVVANIQTLTKRVSELTKVFGTIFIDEVHHLPAKNFKNTVDKFCAKYKIGLSGTLERKDGKHIMLTDYISSKVLVAKDRNVMIPKVTAVKTPIQLSTNSMIPWANRVTQLLDDLNYIELIISCATAQAAKGHTVLIVCDRVEFLKTCAELTNNSICITGATKDRRELLDSLYEDTDKLFGQLSIFKEGISENVLSCLILATPINNVHMLEQVCGRVTRQHPNKQQPEIIDIVLSGNTGRNQFYKRRNFYVQQGWRIREIDA